MSIITKNGFERVPFFKTLKLHPVPDIPFVNTGNGKVKCHGWAHVLFHLKPGINLQIVVLVCDSVASTDMLIGKVTLDSLRVVQKYHEHILCIPELVSPCFALNETVIPPDSERNLQLQINTQFMPEINDLKYHVFEGLRIV